MDRYQSAAWGLGTTALNKNLNLNSKDYITQVRSCLFGAQYATA